MRVVKPIQSVSHSLEETDGAVVADDENDTTVAVVVAADVDLGLVVAGPFPGDEVAVVGSVSGLAASVK